MSNWHVLERSGSEYRIAYHIGVPAANNLAAVSYRTAIVNSKAIGASVLTPPGPSVLPDGDGTAGTVSAAEKADLEAGSVVEHVVTLSLPDSMTNPQKLAAINADYAANSATLLAELQVRLSQFGRVG